MLEFGEQLREVQRRAGLGTHADPASCRRPVRRGGHARPAARVDRAVDERIRPSRVVVSGPGAAAARPVDTPRVDANATVARPVVARSAPEHTDRVVTTRSMPPAVAGAGAFERRRCRGRRRRDRRRHRPRSAAVATTRRSPRRRCRAPPCRPTTSSPSCSHPADVIVDSERRRRRVHGELRDAGVATEVEVQVVGGARRRRR